MAHIAETLTDWASNLTRDALPEAVIATARRTLIDTGGLAVAGRGRDYVVGRQKEWLIRTMPDYAGLCRMRSLKRLVYRGFQSVSVGLSVEARKRPCDSDLANPALAGLKWP